jgi:hypothetical protein
VGSSLPCNNEAIILQNFDRLFATDWHTRGSRWLPLLGMWREAWLTVQH